ncbi:hypothetical protein PHMEG_00022451 [Phytophthora megakarya]|uniref:Uncharacterized protein n=1 Tax=Phytophthora megakarya TaxID=4795 RepID=A0A225VIQ1_9STRA|nr:hypothetical protein PHMEG_00022451 [Phytophthora megakarya]
MIASYYSDPVLAVGATMVWYDYLSALREYILPEFNSLVRNGVIPVNSQNSNYAFQTWKLRWADRNLGFCHFIQLSEEPDEDKLWFLFGRRCAGMFARE